MIRELHIENFRCLRDVRMTLEPLTVFVGANASGKSSALDALRGSVRPGDAWGQDRQTTIVVTAIEAGGFNLGWHFQGATGSLVFLGPRPLDCQRLQLDLTQLRVTNAFNRQYRLNENGFGLANLLASVGRTRMGEVAAQFCALVPMFRDIDVRPQSQGNGWVLFQDRWRPDVWYEPQQVSDGSILVLAFLLLPYQSPPPDIIAIEEPERGVHPYLMRELVNVLRKLSRGEIGQRAVQVVLATHSAELLEFVEPKEVRFFSRSSDTGETRVELAPLDDPSWPKALREYGNSLGDLWLAGGLGGVPTS
jgi:predicted ATPase